MKDESCKKRKVHKEIRARLYIYSAEDCGIPVVLTSFLKFIVYLKNEYVHYCEATCRSEHADSKVNYALLLFNRDIETSSQEPSLRKQNR